MPSSPADQHWSLTRRLATNFAVITSLLLAFMALGTSWALYSSLQSEVEDFLQHEIEEFVLDLQKSDGSQAGLQAAADEIAGISKEIVCAFRVRDSAGRIVAQAGDATLLKHSESLRPSGTHRLNDSLLLQEHYLFTRPLPGTELTAEMTVNAAKQRKRLLHMLLGAGIWLGIAVALAGFLGWLTAWRGLRELRAMVSQVRGIARPTRDGIRLANPPVELQGLGDEVNAMLERIELGLREMQTFTAGLAHELRSPLQNLQGETEVALLVERSPEAYRDLLASHLDEFANLSDAIDNLIAWCRTYAPAQLVAAHERFDLAQSVELRLARERRSSARAGVELELTCSGDTVLIGDREGCLRVVRNLVANALDWSPRGERVEVRVDGLPDVVRLRVDDRGSGIPPAIGERIFEPFVTTAPRVGQRGGYGLGLAICRTILAQHGGRLWYEARPGGGTTFFAEFPRTTGSSQGARWLSAGAPANTTRAAAAAGSGSPRPQARGPADRSGGA
jgi:signal transduction histidine kinase